MANSKVARSQRRTQTRTEKHEDYAPIPFLRGDLDLVVDEIRAGFDEILEAEFFAHGAERDSLVLSVLRRLRNAETVIGAVGGAS